MCSWQVVEETSPSSGFPFWALGVTTNGCLEYVGENITVEDLESGEDYRHSDIDEYRQRAIKRAEAIHAAEH